MEPTIVAPERPRTVSRRALARGVAWSVPTLVAASAAPALAVSKCQMTTVNWTKGTTTQTTASVTLAGGIKASSTRTGSGVFFAQPGEGSYNGGTYNYNTVTLSPSGMPSGTYLEINQRAIKGSSGAQVMTVTFPQRVYCVDFWVTDFDQVVGDGGMRNYADRLQVSNVTPTAWGSEVTCTGSTCASKYAGSTTAHDGANTLTANAVHYRNTSASGITSFTLTYDSAQLPPVGTSRNYQQLWISPISYSTTGSCSCGS